MKLNTYSFLLGLQLTNSYIKVNTEQFVNGNISGKQDYNKIKACYSITNTVNSQANQVVPDSNMI